MGLLYLTYSRLIAVNLLLPSAGWQYLRRELDLLHGAYIPHSHPSRMEFHTVIISFYATALMLGGMTIATLMVLDLKFAEIKGRRH